ncbi:hypothetical protein [Pararhizobium antarcticum]|nr:hypothetical protein [Pararhizobium antarcticum]
MTRGKPSITFVRGFSGTRDELNEHLQSPDIANWIVKSGCGNRKGEATHVDPFRLAVAKRVIISCKKRAAERQIGFDLSADWMYSELLRQNDRCQLTGMPFDYRPRVRKDDWHKNPFAPSPDRIDRREGYVASNVRIVLTSVNIAINEWGLDHFKAVSRKLLAGELSPTD